MEKQILTTTIIIIIFILILFVLLLIVIFQVLLEKILRSLPQIGNIYVLLRPKKGIASPNDRLKDLFSSPVFSFHSYSQEQLSKVIPLAGDVSLPFFGLSNENLEIIANEVTAIFHVAASIRFDSLLA